MSRAGVAAKRADARRTGLKLRHLVQIEMAFDGPRAMGSILVFDVPGSFGRVRRYTVGVDGVGWWLTQRPTIGPPLDLSPPKRPAKATTHAER